MVISVERPITIVCGPVLSGKTSICRKVLDKTNGKGKYISYEKIWKKLPANMSNKEKKLLQNNIVLQELNEAVRDDTYTVIEIPFLKNQQIMGFIALLQIICGSAIKITLIKVYPNEELHYKNWQNAKGNKPSKYILKAERKKFQEILNWCYNDYNNIVQEHVITDPDEVEYE